MMTRELIRESWRSGVAQLVPFSLIVIIGIAMSVTTISTAGRSAAAQTQVLQQLDAAGSRQIAITDTKDQGTITPQAVDVLQKVSSVARVLGLSVPEDATNSAVGSGAAPVTTWRCYGKLSESVTLVAGRYPRDGEAIVSTQALQTLGMDQPIGSITATSGRVFAVVGEYRVDSSSVFADSALVKSDSTTPLAELLVTTKSYFDSAETQDLALSLLNPADPTSLSVVSPTSLATLQSKILGGLATSNRGIVALVLGAGSLLIAVVCLADILIRRRELGRRRALGISRQALISLVVLRTFIPAMIGVGIGMTAGVIITAASHSVPPWQFLAGLAILAATSAAVSALAPAISAAHQDPVRILRTP